ncbi:unnamed protein product [Lasius platythorax]|uniref:Gustatory receptor n=1 Tax=Lasius platythorax TaxID=488582 RepID=A0AAV2N8Q5_9HYME
MFQPKTLHEMIMPLLVVNFVLGIGIWTSKRGRILNIAYSLLCLVSYCVLMKFSMEFLYISYAHKVDKLGILIFKAMFYTNICSTLLLIPCGWLRKKHMKTAIMRIMMCEKTMEQMGLQKNYRKFYLNQLYALGFVILIFIVFIVINYDGTWFTKDTPLHIKIILVLAVNYPIALLYVSDLSFLHWVRYAKIRFEQLNSLLQRMLTTTPDSPQHKRVLKMKDEWNKTFTSAMQQDRRSEENTDTMRAVKQVHLELTKASRNTNEAYGIQILCSMTTSFVFITSLLYYAYLIFWNPNLTKEVFRQEMIPIVGWILFYASKAANTGDIICELYEPSTSKEFRAEIRDFTLQLIQNPLTFTACGFFNLNHTFIHGVIGSVTTYLVILIQVGDIGGSTKNSSSLYNETNFTTSNTLTTYVN